MSGGMPVYRKQGDPDTWLMYNPNDKDWYVQHTSRKGTNRGSAYLKCDPPCLPENGTKRTWKVWDGSTFQLQADVGISIVTPQKLVAASVRADGHKVKEHTMNNELLINGNNINYFLFLFFHFY